MAWVRFTGHFDWTPAGLARQTTGYLAGMRCLVTQDCQAAALAFRRAEAIKTPRRETAERLKADPFWVGDAGDGS